MAEIKIKKLQTAIFVKNLLIPSGYEKSNFIIDLKKNVEEIFDGEPISLPVPDDAPNDIPRIILTSSNKIYSSNISSIRVDVFSDIPKSDNYDIDNIFEKQKQNSIKIIDFLEEKSVSIFRIGFSVVCETKDSDIKYIKKIKDEYLKGGEENLKEITISLNRNDVCGSYSLNNIFSISTDNIFLNFSIDINTFTTQNDNLSKANLEEIIADAIEKEIKEIKEMNIFLNKDK